MKVFGTQTAVALAASLLAVPATAGDEARLVARVIGAEPDVGQIMANLFDSRETYMRAALVGLTVPVDNDGGATLDFGAHPPGEYAITVFYDENSNGKLDAGRFRIPTEAVGYSNNAKGRFGPAKWKKTRFLLGAEDAALEIRVERIMKKKKKAKAADPGTG